jgi:hypothetical protein
VDSLTRADRSRVEPTLDLAQIAQVVARHPFRHDRRRGELLLRSFVRCYLEDFLPASPWLLEAVERRLSDGRVDLLFRNPSTGQVLGDELKTARGRRGHFDDDDLGQVARYLRCLEGEFGSDLLGVRLIRLGPPAEAVLFRSQGKVPISLRDSSHGAL